MDFFLLFMSLFFNGIKSFGNLLLSLIGAANVAKGNKNSRGVQYFRCARREQAILKSVHWSDNVMITGSASFPDQRNRLILQLIKQFRSEQNIPVVVLHRNNQDLQRRISNLSGSVICDRNNRVYDPLTDQSPEDIASMLFANNEITDKKYHLSDKSDGCVTALCKMYHRLINRPPHLVSLQNCTDTSSNPPMGITNLSQKLPALQNGQNDDIWNRLVAGQAEETKLNRYLSHLLRQMASLSPAAGTKLQDSKYQSIYRTALNNGILCLDTSSISDNDTVYSFIFSEFQNQNLGTVYVVLDDIPVAQVPSLYTMLVQKKFPYCISCSHITDIFMTVPGLGGGSQALLQMFSPVADCSSVQLHLQQANASALVLNNYFGTYRKMQAGYNIGTGSTTTPAHLLSMKHSNSGVTLMPVDDSIWRVDQFTKMDYNGIKMACSNHGTMCYYEYRLKP